MQNVRKYRVASLQVITQQNLLTVLLLTSWRHWIGPSGSPRKSQQRTSSSHLREMSSATLSSSSSDCTVVSRRRDNVEVRLGCSHLFTCDGYK